MQQNNKKLAKKLNKLGIKTKIYNLDRLNSIENTIKDIGKILNKQKEAKNILNEFDLKLNSLKNIIKNQKILIVIGHNLKLDKRIFNKR